MRPIASTCVASMQNIDAPDSASELMCVKCQSLASPSIAEYWHIGATMMRLGSARPRSFIGENRALMGDFRVARKEGLPGHLKTRWWDYQRLATSSRESEDHTFRRHHPRKRVIQYSRAGAI